MSVSEKLSVLKELRIFLRERKKAWLFPMIALLIIIGAMLVFAESSALAPLIYTIF